MKNYTDLDPKQAIKGHWVIFIWSFGHLFIWSFVHLAIWSFGHFGHLGIWSFGHLVIGHLVIHHSVIISGRQSGQNIMGDNQGKR